MIYLITDRLNLDKLKAPHKIRSPGRKSGEVPKWPKGTDCKSVGSAFTGSNPVLPTILLLLNITSQYLTCYTPLFSVPGENILQF